MTVDATSDDVLEDYRGWLYAVVTALAPGRRADWDDLAQEGWIAMWRALRTYDPELGALASWLTTAARLRIADVLRRSTWTGTPGARGHHREEPAMPVDTDWDWTHAAYEERYDDILWAYHTGDILRALDGLPTTEREYVLGRVLRDGGRYSWRHSRLRPETREHLAKQLAHLREEV